MSVGFSPDRTPVKLAMLRALALGDVNFSRPHRGHVFVDLTAGNAKGDGINPWWRASSPAIFAYIAAKFCNVRVRLYEIDKGTFYELIDNLSRRLPSLDYVHNGRGAWRHSCTQSTVEAFRGDSSVLEDFGDVRRHEYLLVNNDPNHVQQWALNMKHLTKCRGSITFMSTMGCNVGGNKMMPLSGRGGWLERVIEALELVRKSERHDLRLARLIGDINQFAYLLLTPCGRTIHQSVPMIEYSWRAQPQLFERMINELLYTKHERVVGYGWHHEVSV